MTEEILAAEAKGDLALARLRLDTAKALEATAETPITLDDMRRESWLWLASVGKSVDTYCCALMFDQRPRHAK